jgi:predicted ferric reductase
LQSTLLSTSPFFFRILISVCPETGLKEWDGKTILTSPNISANPYHCRITTCNIALVTFLALKNTPLAFLTVYSYERLNILHQAAGCCTVLFALLHAILFIVTDAKLGSLSDLLELEQIMGIVACLAMLSMLTTALIIRRVRYEAFYIFHICMFMLVLVAVAVHRSQFRTKSIYIIIFSTCIWVSDRLLRGFRMLFHAFGNRANVYPLSQGGIRVVMRRTPWRAVPGTHVFLWVPKVRAIETHPFTVVLANPLEVIISSRDGFTRDLFSLASKRPGVLLTASCDGPYGTLPNFAKFEHVILLAGGSGATFTIGVAVNLIHNLAVIAAKPVIHFIWVIRDHGEREYLIISGSAN